MKKPNYSGFDWEKWTHRETAKQKDVGKKVQTSYFSESSRQYSKGRRHQIFSFVRTINFDIVRCHVIDPMHCIFLGIAKYAVKTWRGLKLLNPQTLSAIQKKVGLINPPPKLGRIPRKIEAGFSSFTADEWKYWIQIYSTFSLHETLPQPYYDCWLHFVEACHLLCCPIITEAQVEKGHLLLV